MTELLALLAVASATVPLPTYPECGQPDRPDLCPPDLGENWKLISYVPEAYRDTVRTEEHAIGTGLWADRAWRLTTGRTDVVIAVLDSGIRWDHSGLVHKHWLNADELPLPHVSGVEAASHDANGDGVFNIADWADDERVSIDAGQDAADHMLDPSDLIHTFSDDVDDDDNGFVDDISGWDFMWNDNDPYDDTRYGHGTGEASDSAQEGGDGGGIGVCPSCMVLNVRVGDSFIVDGQSFASGVLFAVDSGSLVVQEALGALSDSDHVRAAIDYAWDHGVTVIASAADENHWHHNVPGINHHTVYVHAVRYDEDDRDDARTFLSYSNCTNHGAKLVLSAPSTSCSSGATGVSAGVAGLMYSAALDVGVELSANEAYQLLTTTTDDIWVPDAMPDWYPSLEGWDRYYGYGRVNAAAIVEALHAGEIPPEADLLMPSWFEVIDPSITPELSVTGLARADRSTLDQWVLEVAPGIEPSEAEFEQVASGGSPVDGTLGTVDLTALPMDPDAAIPAYEVGMHQVDREDLVNTHTVTLRLRVSDTDGLVGEMRKAFYVHSDPDRLDGFPRWMGASLESHPTLVDLDGDGALEIVVADGGGAVHAVRGDGSELSGWPVSTELLEEVDPDAPGSHLDAPAYDEVDPLAHAGAISAPAAGDLDGDGEIEVVVGTLRGDVQVYGADGSTRAGFPVWQDLVDHTTPDIVLDEGFVASPALGDLDGDGDVEIVVAGMDQQVYAWHDDGSVVDGWPVLVAFPGRDERCRIVSSPALGDLDGDGELDVVLGTNEILGDTSAAAYALRGSGDDHPDGPFLPGWPITLFSIYPDLLPYVGEGAPTSPALVDHDGDGDLEVAMNALAGDVILYDHEGTEVLRAGKTADRFGSGSNANDPTVFPLGTPIAIGDLDGDGTPDLVHGSTGFGYLEGQLDDGHFVPYDHALSAIDGTDGDFLRGFPQVMADLQFLASPVIADVDGDQRPEAIAGSGGYLLRAWDEDGDEPDGWPKFTGQWIVASAAVGDVDGDGFLDVVAGTRAGWLFAWSTPSPAGATVEWQSFGHDPANTANFEANLDGYNSGYPDPGDDEERCGCGIAVGGVWWPVVVLAAWRRQSRG